ncbi:hypothetical protein DL96DRAFT_1816892 [Flagelloscypha sp. PMI_526]|nr:hypothetical protein DL96DRAFT_1816892 [Flagelloscypha sp. PMI_526]
MGMEAAPVHPLKPRAWIEPIYTPFKKAETWNPLHLPVMGSYGSLDVAGLFGSLLIGCFITCVLFGVTTAQFYIYLAQFSDDAIWLKILASTVWTLEMIHQFLFAHAVYVFLINAYGHPEILAKAPVAAVEVLPAISGLIGFIVRGFFIYRIHQFSRSIVLVCFLCLITCAALGLVLSTISVIARLDDNLILYEEKHSVIATLGFSAAAFSDVSIALSMTWFLSKWKVEGIQGGVRRIVHRLTVWTLETGLTTSGLMIFSAVSQVIWRDKFIYIAVWYVAYRIYSNSLFVALNGRITLRKLDHPSSFATSRKKRSSLVFAATSSEQKEETQHTTTTEV